MDIGCASNKNENSKRYRDDHEFKEDMKTDEEVWIDLSYQESKSSQSDD